MTEPTPADPVPSDSPGASSDAASAPTRGGFTLRGRAWVYGATLAAAGVLAGSGVTYAVVATTPTSQSQAVSVAGDGPRGGPMGAPADGQPGTRSEGQVPGGTPSSDPSPAGGPSS